MRSCLVIDPYQFRFIHKQTKKNVISCGKRKKGDPFSEGDRKIKIKILIIHINAQPVT